MPSRKTKPVQRVPEIKDSRDTNTPPDVRMLQVFSLRVHPEQAKLVGDMPPAEFEALVADIKVSGIQIPLIILADCKTIVCGHQRHRAAVELGIEQVPCIVRQDLRDADDPAVLKLLLSDNLRRRQLGPLEKARYAQKLVEIELGRRIDPDCSWERPKQIALREAVGKLLGCTGRNAARYLAALSTPTEIQQAFDSGLLPLTRTAQISFLSPDVQQRLAKSISKARSRSNIADPETKQAVQSLVMTALNKARPPKGIRPPSPSAPLFELKRFLELNVALVREGRDQIIAHIGGDPESRDPPLFDKISLRPVIEVREQCESLLLLLNEIQRRAKPELAVREPSAIQELDADDQSVAGGSDSVSIADP